MIEQSGSDAEIFGALDCERRARQSLEPDVFAWFAGGAGGERTLRDNVDAFSRWQLRPRVLVNVSAPSAATTVLGHHVSLPVLVAPVAFQRFVHPEGEAAMARGSAAAGTVMCMSTMATTSFADIAAAAPGAARWLQLYHLTDRERTRAIIDAGRDAGASAIVLTVDSPVRGRPDRARGTGFLIPEPDAVPNVVAAMDGEPFKGLESLIATTLTWRDLEWLVTETGLPVVLKGILTGEDAHLACESGAAGVIVSNHGGRQLDGVSAGIDALSEVVEAVAGRIEVMMDGGVRRGTDVVTALALGARAVLVGRPLVWALCIGGAAGVERLLDVLAEEVTNALTLLGAPRPDLVTRAHVSPTNGRVH
jgi:isopentenyl diphosphate isomerase/L-lactate dehydrogenase-like FMN-dependent dehydrogenase